MFGVLKLGKLGASMKKAGFNPRTLFAASEPGAWYDPADLSTLFQDSAFTVPVTAVEQPVGGMLDLSGRGNHATQATTTKRPVLSARYGLIAGTEMTGGAGGAPGTAPDQWQLHIMNGTYAHTIENGKHRFTASVGRSTVRAPMTWLPNVTYVINLDLINNTTSNSSVNQVAYAGLQSGTGVSLAHYVDGVVTSTIPPGMHTIKIVCSFTGGSPLPYLYIGAGAGGPDTADITALKCSVTLATDAHLPYQRVNTATDYDADPAKFPAYLRFDGVDDALQTRNIDFTSTDKMTVWAGVNEASTPQAVIVELTSFGLNTGAFTLYALSGARFAFASIGPSPNNAATEVVPELNNYVATGYSDVAGGICGIRLNGAPTAVALTGSGNHANSNLYIGARGGVSNYLNGRLYSLIVRGAQSSLSQIEATELYMKKKVGIA